MEDDSGFEYIEKDSRNTHNSKFGKKRINLKES